MAFKRLLGGMPKIGVVTGHGERSIHDSSNRGYERQQRVFLIGILG